MRARQEDRTKALRAFMSSPQSMEEICDFLRLKNGSQVHKDLLRAIVQITGYGKKYPKNCGLIDSRNRFSDGTYSDVFTESFQAIVDDFLNGSKRRAGVIFFPTTLPNYNGWDNSFWGEGGEHRLVWNSKIDQEDIRGCMLLLFENLKDNGVQIDLTGAEVYESFETDDCDDCGSGDASDPDNDIVYCDICRAGHHQKCYGIFPKPKAEDSWVCHVCAASKSDSTTKKRRQKKKTAPKRERPTKEESDHHEGWDNESVGTRRASLKIPKKEDPRYLHVTTTTSDNRGTSHSTKVPKKENLSHDSHATTTDWDNETLQASRKTGFEGSRRSSLNIPKVEHTQQTRRVVSQPISIQSVLSMPRSALAHIPPYSMLTNVLEDDGTSLINISAISKGIMTRPEPSLHRSEIQGTVLLTRLKDDEICRKVPLTSTRTVKTLFEWSAERWPEKFAGQEISRLLYVDEDKHLVEIVKESSSDFKEFLTMIARRWNNNDEAEVIHIEVYLLAAGESIQL